jgi:mRNA interferase RelE/StbE
MYNVLFSKSAEKEFLNLTDDMKERVIGVLERISVQPHRYVRRLTGVNAYRLRVGKFRVIIDINERTQTIEVLKIGNRETVYQ